MDLYYFVFLYFLYLFRDSLLRFLCSEPLPHTEACAAEREKEVREERAISDTEFQTPLKRTHKDTKLLVNTRFGKYSGKHSRLVLKVNNIQLKRTCRTLCFRRFLNWETGNFSEEDSGTALSSN